MSHPVHKPFQDTEISKSSSEPPDSVDCSKPLFINDEAWLRNCCRFQILGCQYKSQCIICHRKFFTPGVRFCCCVSFFLESPWRVELYRHTGLYLGQKNSNKIVPWKEKPGLKLRIGNALDSCRVTLEMPVDLGFPVSSAARNPVKLVISTHLW